MIARVWRAPVVEGRLLEYERFVHDVVVPLFKAADGNLGVLTMRRANRASSISLWATEEAMHRFFRSHTYREIVERSIAQGILGAPQTGDAFDVHDGFIDDGLPMFF